VNGELVGSFFGAAYPVAHVSAAGVGRRLGSQNRQRQDVAWDSRRTNVVTLKMTERSANIYENKGLGARDSGLGTRDWGTDAFPPLNTCRSGAREAGANWRYVMKRRRPLRVRAYFAVIAVVSAFSAWLVQRGAPLSTTLVVACGSLATCGVALLVRELYIPIKRRPLEEVRFPARWFLLDNAVSLGVIALICWKHPDPRLAEFLAAALMAVDICAVGEWLWNRRFAAGPEGHQASMSHPKPNLEAENKGSTTTNGT